MKRYPILLALAALASFPSSAQNPASVDARFENPGRFTDFRARRWSDPRETEALVVELRRWIESEAPRFLPAGSKLTVTITDVDMAGEFEPWHRADSTDVRVVREIHPSRVSLAFSLADETGKVVMQGERKLISAFVLGGILRGGDGPLGYEKALLADWLKREFARDGARHAER